MGKAGTVDARRIPCLDGIRAVSIALVLVSHLVGTRGFEVSDSVSRFANLGTLGVRVFFVISGFLITTLLLAERKKYGSISLLHFYFRRTFRIFPAFYAFIAILVVVEAIGWIALRDWDVVHAVSYTTNYHHDRAWEFGHLWSLAVEEQFYLLWPAMLLLFGIRGGILCAAAYIVIAPLVRVLTFVYLPEFRTGIGETFQTVADSIATGCVLAAIRPWLGQQTWFVRIQDRSVTVLSLVVVIFVINYYKGYVSMSYPVGETVMNVSIALFLDWCLRHPSSRLGRVFDWRPLAFIGVLSYSLYLWQQPFLNRHSDALVASFPLNIVCMFAAALASYYLIEKPCLDWRNTLGKKWLPKRTPKPAPADGDGPG